MLSQRIESPCLQEEFLRIMKKTTLGFTCCRWSASTCVVFHPQGRKYTTAQAVQHHRLGDMWYMSWVQQVKSERFLAACRHLPCMLQTSHPANSLRRTKEIHCEVLTARNPKVMDSLHLVSNPRTATPSTPQRHTLKALIRSSFKHPHAQNLGSETPFDPFPFELEALADKESVLSAQLRSSGPMGPGSARHLPTLRRDQNLGSSDTGTCTQTPCKTCEPLTEWKTKPWMQSSDLETTWLEYNYCGILWGQLFGS